jgi:flagellar motor switch protein FliN
MDSQARRKGATLFAQAFAESVSGVLSEAANAKMEWKVSDDGNPLASDSALVQYRVQVEGALSGECFVEFYESQIAALLGKIDGQPTDSLSDEQKMFFAKFVVAAVKKLVTSPLNTYGDFSCKLEPVSGLSFGGMFVVPIAASAAQPEMQASLYFGTQLLAGLASPFVDDKSKGANPDSLSAHNLNLVMDVELNVSMRFGKRQLSLREVLELESGSVVELDRLVDEPVELYLDRKLIARGEAVVVDGNYGLRVTEIPQPIASQLLN